MVVTILSAVAWMALGAVNNNMDQVRFDDTKNRLETIKRAIIGDTSRTINGQPEIRGYVADMGVLPDNLQALIQKDFCEDYPTEDNDTDCGTAGGTWVEQGEYCSNHTSVTESACTTAGATWVAEHTYDDDFGIWTGWNGPYLDAKELIGYSKFRDGWGNMDATSPNNFGWLFSESSGDLTVRSYGKEGETDVTGTTTGYDLDYPPTTASDLVLSNDYKLDISSSTLTVSLSPPSTFTVTSGLCLKLAIIIDGEIDDYASAPSSIITSTIDTSTSTLPTWDGTTKPITFNGFTGTTTEIPLGKIAYQLTDYDGSVCTTAVGSDNGTSSSWRSFTYVPKATLPVLYWNVP